MFRNLVPRIASTAVVAPIVVLLIISAVVLATASTARPVSAGTTDDELSFVRLINDLREDQGLQPLSVDTELTAEARAWARSMAEADDLAHAPDMSTGITAPWTVLGENVGVNATHDVGGLFDAFVASPTHYQNLIDPRFGYVGVGVVYGPDGELWTTHRFMATAAATAPTTPQTAPPATTQPSTTRPTTTAAPDLTDPTGSGNPAEGSTTTETPASAPASTPTTNDTANRSDGASDAGTTTGSNRGSVAPNGTTPDGETGDTTAGNDDATDTSSEPSPSGVADNTELVDEIVLDVDLIEQVLIDVAAVPF